MIRTIRGRRFAAVLVLLVAAGALVRCKEDSPMQPGGCEVSRTVVEFGTVAIGDTKDASFSINNTGEAVIRGDVVLGGENCPFVIVIGGGAYEIAPGGSRPVVVSFTPIGVGGTSCRVEVGGGCPAVALSGLGAEAPECVVRSTPLDFGPVAVGDTGERTLTIANIGAGVLIGTLAVPPLCFELSIVGDGAFSIAPNDSQSFVVRYAPTAEMAMACTLAMGTDACVRVPVSGSGAPAPTCALDVTALDFGTLVVGDSLDRDFTITNTGIGVLAGTAGGGDCAGLRAVGTASYQLAASEMATITARLVPTEPGALNCFFESGSPFCEDVMVTAFVLPAPTCSLSTDSLDFETVPVGENAERTFTITNAGGGTLSGTVSSPCGDFAIVGAAGYTLGAGASADFTVRFVPAGGGTRTCAIATGAASCPTVSARGVGLAPPTCAVSTGHIEFGGVEIGTSSDRTFTIRNIGGGTLSGTVSVPGGCAGLALLGSADYKIGEADSQAFTLRFTPVTEDTVSCTLETGSALCPDLAIEGSGFRDPECALSADTLDFGAVPVGGQADRTLTITNTGGSILSGMATVSGCGPFTLVGETSYSLAANAQKILTIRFAPTAEGEVSCAISPGSELCEGVVARGSGAIVAGCDVSPTLLDFGTVTLGTSRDSTFTITNTGNGTLAGTVSASACDAFSIVGDATYDLAPKGSQQFTVRFAPTGEGQSKCAITTGDAACLAVTVTGAGEPAPECVLSTSALDFGTVSVGQTADRTFSIRNAGGGILAGGIETPCGDFAVIGSADYNLAAADSQVFTIRFTPSGPGEATCTIETGDGACEDVSATGSGDDTPLCTVSPDTLRFGTFLPAETETLAIVLTNGGTTTISGTATESCTRFFFVGGAGYTAGPGLSDTLMIRYAPNVPAPETCAVNIGSGCPPVTLIGGGCPIVCTYLSVAADSLLFGTVTVGQCATRNFTIKNTGCTTITGSVPATCGTDFVISTGSGNFSLGQNATRPVTVRFKPTTEAAVACTLDFGDNTCANLMLSGTGGPGPECAVNKTTLPFGTLRVNSSSTQILRVTNTGSGVMIASVGFSGSCPDFSFVGATIDSLAANEFKDFTVRFKPLTPGSKSCAVQVTGSVLTPCEGTAPTDFCTSPLTATGTGDALFCATSVAPLLSASCSGCHPGGPAPALNCNTVGAYINVSNPASSELLQRASVVGVPHTGGKPWPVGSQSYNTVLQWITEGGQTP